MVRAISKVTQVHRAVGSWGIQFDGLPQELIDQLDELGHIAITEVREDGPSLGDSLLSSARYVGVVIGRRKESEGQFTLRGPGMAWWLGTEDKLGKVYETAKTYAAATFSAVITDLLPPAVTPGTLTNTGLPPYTGTHQYVSPREAIDYVCDTVGAQWRVNGDGTITAGPHASVFATGRALIVRRATDAGEDMTLRAFPGPAQTDRDREDFTTRVVVLGKVEDASVATGSWDIAGGLNPYKDIHGNPVQLTRLASESATEGVNATARAAAIGAQYQGPQRALSLDTGTYDLRGQIDTGDLVWIYDPEAGLEDANNEIQFRGQRLNPVQERVTAMTWPVTAAMGVYYRSRLGAWLDLSPWLAPSGDQTTIEVGKNPRSLVDTASSPVGRVPEPDTSIPGVPAFVTPFKAGVYQQGDTGVSKAQVQAKWTGPATNTDATPFVDGSHFEIGYRTSSNPLYPATYSQAAANGTYASLGTWGTPITQTFADWQTAFAPIDATTALITELSPGTPYEFRVRALDSAAPPNAGAWSATYTQYTPVDVDPPNTPAAAVVAGSKIAVLVTHYLGDDGGGTFNLALDLARLDVHIGSTVGFTPDATTLVGKIIATQAQIRGRIPVLGTFPVDTTAQIFVKVVAVDEAGNSSPPSAGAPVTAELIDAQWVGSVFAENVIAGTVLGSFIIGGEFTTATSGQRVRFGFDGLEAYLADGVTKFLDVDIASESLTVVGTWMSAFTGPRFEAVGDTIKFFPSSGAVFGTIQTRTFSSQALIELIGGTTRGDLASGQVGAHPDEGYIRWGIPLSAAPNSFVVARIDHTEVHGPAIRFVIDRRFTAVGSPARQYFDWYSLDTGGNTIAASRMIMQVNGANQPWLNSPAANSGLYFGTDVIGIVNNAGNAQEITASVFTPISDEAAKTDIGDIPVAAGDPDDDTTLERLVPRRYRLLDQKERLGEAAPWHYGLMAQEMPAEIRRPVGMNGQVGYDLGSLVTLLWKLARRNAQVVRARLNTLTARTVRSVETRVALPALTADTPVDVAVVWPGAPLPLVPDTVTVGQELPAAGIGKIATRVLPASITADGCTVRVTPTITAAPGSGQLHVTALAWQ